ncbi:MAG: putative iron-regulated membrane protein [Saprospiraceae bacterium]|jgi:uncharacterized iron-regulated membrane protein
MKRIIMQKSILFLFTLLALTSSLHAQGDQIDNGGKIFTVVVCVAVILLGIVAFLFYLERRISRIEEINKVN